MIAHYILNAFKSVILDFLNLVVRASWWARKTIAGAQDLSVQAPFADFLLSSVKIGIHKKKRATGICSVKKLSVEKIIVIGA